MTSLSRDASQGKVSESSSSDSSKQAAVVWPNKKDDYELLDVVGSGATSVVQVADCKPLNVKVAIKRIDLERCGASIEELRKEISLMSMCNHPNVVNYYTSFVVKDELWLVMRLMAGGSLLDIVKHVLTKNPKGGVLDEVVIATVLKEVLQGLDYLHGNSQIHRDMKAGNILVGHDGSVQLADFGVSNWLYDSHHLAPDKRSKKAPRMTFVGTPCWMAPEVMDQSLGYNEKADIWSFGITALELATGTAPYAKFPPMKVLMLTLENPAPTLETCGDLNGEDYRKNYSKSFHKMVEKCLQRDSDKRPSASELLKFQFFKKAKDKEFLKEVILGDAPSLQSRGRKVRRVPGSSGHLHKDEEGAWVWSDDELEEESSKNELNVPKQAGADTPSFSQTTSSSASNSQPPPLAVPETAVQPPTSSSSAEMIDLLQQRQAIVTQKAQVEQQLTQAKLQQQALLQQQASGQVTQEQHMAVLKMVQTLERQRQQVMFQLQQIELSVQQLQDALAMEEQFQQAMKVQKQTPEIGQPMKLSLRKRTQQNQLKDIKFGFVPGKAFADFVALDFSDVIAKDLVAAGLVEGKNLVVVAANINKIVENRSLEKVNFQLVTDLTPDQLDEKKLIGYAQLSIVRD